jgi:glycosyltransferase involved in cell wall biosynthesis
MAIDVGVVIPTYNEPKRVLKKSIESVICQTFSNVSAVVVNDGGSTRAKQLVDELDDDNVEYIQHEDNKGGSAARNTGADYFDTKYLAFLDADDTWEEEKIEKQVKILEGKDENWVACYCDVNDVKRTKYEISDFAVSPHSSATESLDSDPRINLQENSDDLISLLVDGDSDIRTGGSSTILIKKSTFDRMGGFDEEFARLQDVEFFIRALKRGKLAFIDEPLVTKYESSPPDPKAVKESMSRFLECFSEDIISVNKPIFQIYRAHIHKVGIIYLQNGYIKDALRYIDHQRLRTESSPLQILWWIVRGVVLRIRKTRND